MKIKELMFISGVMIMGLTGCSQSIEIDSTNEIIENESTKKIVSVTVSATEVLDALDVELVGVPTTKYILPTRYNEVTSVGQAMSPDFEIIASLQPDLVVIDQNFEEDVVKSVESFGMNAFYFDTSTYSSFLESIDTLAGLVDKQEQGKILIESLNQVAERVQEKGGEQELTVAILFGGGENFMLATDTSYLGDLVQTVGADNITDDLKVDSAYIPFSMEQLVAANPDYILRFAHGNIEETKKAFDDAFDKNPAFGTLEAVKKGKVVDLDPSIYGVSANMRVKKAMEELGNLFYGE